MPAYNEAQIAKLLVKYHNISATKKDVIDVLDAYPSLTYSVQKFVFNDGKAKDLFSIKGTIPVIFKKNTYYIPISIWLMNTHPQNAPLCFVTPTPTMEIKVSMYVDYNGKIYLPYLHDWQPQTSDLLSLIQVMIVTFGDCPPVYSKRKTDEMPPYPTNSYMPQPVGSNGPSASNTFLPYPTSGVGGAEGGASGGSGSSFPPFYGSYPAFPNASGSKSMPVPNAGNTVGGGGYPPYMNFPQVPGYGSGFSSSNASSTGTITEEHIKASLISAVEDILRRRIQQYQAEIETLNRTKQELIEGSTKIDGIMARLQREEVELKKNIAILQEKEEELIKNLETLEQAEAIDPDEAVTTTAPLYKQLLNAYAEEAAIEDAIYYLGEGLRSSVIDLETFLKHVRQLSRKQFILRATMQKCRQKAGLAG